jgi:UDP-N-acetylmuramoyl-L-alanyl-D-glutamate--2,6-diaminopimelate ligase
MDALSTQLCSTADRLLSLRALLPEAVFPGSDDIRVGGCQCDSRQVQPGEVFAALPGSRHDGRDFVTEAIARGAAGIVCQPPLDAAGVPVCIVSNAREAYGRICQALAGNPSHQLKLIGVTGASGKTATSCLIASILCTADHRVGLLGSLGYSDGRMVGPAAHATPHAKTLAHWLARMVANQCSHAVMEVAGHALAQSRLAGLRLDAACVTNVRRDRLNHGPAKSKLLDYLSPEGFAVINADDPVAASYLHNFAGPALTVGVHSDAEITAVPLEQCPSEQIFLLTAGSETMPVRTRMIGLDHVYNCLTAAAVGLAYGLDLSAVVRGLEAVDYVPGRLQRIECGQPFSVFVDHARTPEALSRCLQTLRQVTAGRLICVFGGGGDLDRQKRPPVGRALADGADLAIVTSENAPSKESAEIAGQVLAGFRQPEHVRLILDRTEAICQALAQAGPGDCVLIAGQSQDDFRLVDDERMPLDDCQIAQQWLYTMCGQR